MQSTTRVQLFLEKLQGVRRTGPGKWIARCPAHDDRSPSLSLKETPAGNVLLYCFAGCQFGDIIGALDMRAADCFSTDLSTLGYRNAAARHEGDAEIEMLQRRYGLSPETAEELAAVGRIRSLAEGST